MEFLDFIRENYQKILLVFNLFLFTEVITLLFLLLPSDFLTSSFNVFVFDLFFLIYFLVTLVVPWFFIFLVQDVRKFYYILIVSLASYFVILVTNLFVTLPVHVVLYLILLKSLMVGLASLFKSLLSLIDRKESLEKTDFTFQSKTQANYMIKKQNQFNSYKKDIFGGIYFLLFYPLIILLLTYFFGFLN